MPGLGEISGASNLIDPNEDMNLAMLLISYRYSKLKEFNTAFGGLLKPEDQKEIERLIEAGVADVKTMSDGARFAVEKLKDVPRKNPKSDGVLKTLEKGVAVYEWGCTFKQVLKSGLMRPLCHGL